MQPNPVLRRLGFSDTDRVAIIHTDDIGMNYSSVGAFADLWEFGLISSGAVMIPCPWALKAAEYAREHPQADLGVHSTLTSEWKTYRWGPISTRDPRSGMVDEEGFFYHQTNQAQSHADPACVQVELEAQIQHAVRMGIQPTHIDTHMGVVGALQLIPVYLKVALAHRLPPMAFRMSIGDWQARGMDLPAAETATALMSQLEAMGLPLLDAIHGLDLGQPESSFEQAKQAFASLKPGITHFIIHPAKDSPDLREIAPDWRARVANYETFLRSDLRDFVKDQGVQVIGYRALQALMPDPSIVSALPF
ncbi:MAG: polysaccharide deacetylase family protein [Anaerolineaceae bacterium]|nr:polysaccharide deacetylase family protein [Anaerolineaceae bacterium]